MISNNYNSIEQFRKWKGSVRGSTDCVLIGIDVAKEKHVAFFGTPRGEKLLRRFSFKNNREGFEKLLIKTEEIRVRKGLQRVLFGLEPTACYHKPLAEYLIGKGYFVVLVDAVTVKRNRETLDGRWDKNDPKDSANVADLLSQGKCIYYDHPSEKIRELRSLLSLRRKLKKQEHSLRLRIRNHLITQYFPELDPFFNTIEAECLGIINHCFDPSVIGSMEFKRFVEMVSPAYKSLRQQQRLRQVWELARQSIGCKVSKSTQLEGSILVDSFKGVRTFVSHINKRIEELCSTIEEYACLLSIPGFGPVISAMTIGAIGDPMRFQNGRQVLKLVGLDLSASRSGKSSQKIIGKISKKGKAELRYALYQAAFTASSRHYGFIGYFTGILERRHLEAGIKTKMRVKLAAKMLIIAWTLMKKKMVFDPTLLLEKPKVITEESLEKVAVM